MSSVKSATIIRRINGWLTLCWVALAVPSILLWRESVPYLVFLSVYAIIVSHLSAWIAGRAEVASETNPPPQEK